MQLQILPETVSLQLDPLEAEDLASALLVAGRGLRMAAGLTACSKQRRELCDQAARIDDMGAELQDQYQAQGLSDLDGLVSAPWPRGLNVASPDVRVNRVPSDVGPE